MYSIEFYETVDGKSELWDFLEDLRIRSVSSKDARIQFNQISLYIQLLEEKGTRLPENITKHLEGNIWELRPGNNRVLYYYFNNNNLFSCTISERKRRKRLAGKLRKQKLRSQTI